MREQNALNGCGGPKLIFACSGAADVGAVADQAARKLCREGAGAMFCMAGLGGQVPPILEKTRSASRILAIDGCPLNCVKESLKNAGFTQFDHMLVTELGLEKGKTEVNETTIAMVTAHARSLLEG